MSDAVRATVYFEPALHLALKMKSASLRRPLSELVNDAVRQSLAEDQEDLKAFADRVAEPTMSYEALLNRLKTDGRL